MPFITEELWAVTAGGAPRPQLLALTPWPEYAAGLDDDKAEAEIGWVIDLVTTVRSIRSEMNVAPATLLPLVLAGVSPETKARANRWIEFLQRLARLGDISFADRAPEGAVQLLVRGEIAALPLKGVIDLAAERARLEKEMGKADADIARVDAKLSNADFMRRAPEEVVDGEREKRDEAQARRTKIVEAIEILKGAV
jgi:valyl-tRNA synthetase